MPYGGSCCTYSTTFCVDLQRHYESNAQLRDVLENGAENELEELAHARQPGHFNTDHSERNRQMQVATSNGQITAAIPRFRGLELLYNSATFSVSQEIVVPEAEADMDTLTALKSSRGLVHAVTTAATVEEPPASNEVVPTAVSAVAQVFQAELTHLPDPRSYIEAMRSPDKEL